MALTVEDGTGLADAESYVSVADCEAYCTARGLTFSTGATPDKEAALRRATSYIDGAYRARFIGWRTNGRAQALAWPRRDAFDVATGEYLVSDEIPPELVAATCEAAVRELAEPGALAPDLERGGAIRSLKAGSVGIEYAGNAPVATTFTAIENALAPLLNSTGGGLVGRAVRG